MEKKQFPGKIPYSGEIIRKISPDALFYGDWDFGRTGLWEKIKEGSSITTPHHEAFSLLYQ
jgi:hypothetical protein